MQIVFRKGLMPRHCICLTAQLQCASTEEDRGYSLSELTNHSPSWSSWLLPTYWGYESWRGEDRGIQRMWSIQAERKCL